MSDFTTRKTCRLCDSPRLVELFSLGDQCVSDFLLPEEVGKKEVRCPIELVLCPECTLVQQRHTARQDFLYTRHYWYRSGTTETMRKALADVVTDVTGRVQLQLGDVVLDIGSNDGTLLRTYPADLRLTKVGVEPASNLVDEGRVGLSLFVNEFWDGDSCSRVLDTVGPCKVVTALGMFYDLEDPGAFIANVARVLHPDGVFVAQLMCLKQTVQLGDVGNFAHEHLEFYSLASLSVLFHNHGLEIVDVEENAVNGGSYRVFAGHARNIHNTMVTPAIHRIRKAYTAEFDMNLADAQTYDSLFQKMERNRDECVRYLRDQREDGKDVWVYGASTKGNVIAQWYGLNTDLIYAAGDRSPEKNGRVMVGTNIPIFGEDDMRAMLPDVCLVLPYAFLREFVDREAGYTWRKRGGKFAVPLPEFKVV